MNKHLVFLKLGGSLITVKGQAHTVRPEVLERLAQEIAAALAGDTKLQIVLGHGSGSFGHSAASRYNTRQGVVTTEQWEGFAEVWRQAAELNHLVMSALESAHLPAIVFPPSATVIAQDGRVSTWNLAPLRAALDKNLLPVVYGDVAFDQERGGTILSTEDLFSYMAHELEPAYLLFAGLEAGVWDSFPARHQLVKEITPTSFFEVVEGLKGSSAMDVTGGMLDKVRQVIALVNDMPGLQGMIFSGDVSGNVQRTLLGEKLGTIIHSA